VKETQRKRPLQVAVVAILGFLLSLLNIWVAVQGIGADLSSWYLLSDPSLPAWFKMAGPVEFGINVAVLIAALLQLLVVLGLWTGKRWSPKLALVVPVAIAILNLSLGTLYASAPPEISQHIGGAIVQGFVLGIFQIVLVLASWIYLRKSEAKIFFGLTDPQISS
jgi:hypothetical protein